MTEKILKNNQAVVAGEIISDFEFSHEVFGEEFYMVKLKVSRLSHSSDTIPLLVSERLINVSQSYIGRFMEAKGQFRSYNKHENNRNHLVLSLFVRELELLDVLDNRKPNMIFLDGYICKEPVYRTTPLGREIADVLLAVNRAYSKSDYIPCICWGRNARYAGSLPVGSRIQLWGRIQSREYQKKIGDDNVISRIAYEVSVNKMEYCDDGMNVEHKVADSGNIG
ncbi:MAG: single-stranded DNA-binding protein [Clostridiales bacterium]|nr:single-stranded DNA-binding protein [Clostridiales bacterium]